MGVAGPTGPTGPTGPVGPAGADGADGPHTGGVNNVYTSPAFIGGGEDNTASGLTATVGAGENNQALGPWSAVLAGLNNTANGTQSTVVGGSSNTASLGGSFVGGGFLNTASATHSAVLGGRDNTASGMWSTVAGGRDNDALADYAFAAGRMAAARHTGTFVWGDSAAIAKESAVADSFNVFAGGGTVIYSMSDGTTGVFLAPGSGTWSTVSDRSQKTEVRPVDVMDVLARVAAMPVWTWRYLGQDGVRHMGPMAQDFHAAFGLGVGDTTIDTVDPDGVALAAIQALDRLVAEKEARIRELEERLDAVERRLGPEDDGR